MSLWERAKNYAHGAETLREWVGDGGVVDPALAQRRADTCIQCGFNQPGPKPIEHIAEAAKKLLEFKNAMQIRVNGEHRLFTCQVCECPLRTKVHIPFKRVKPTEEEKPHFPAKCWLLKEQE